MEVIHFSLLILLILHQACAFEEDALLLNPYEDDGDYSAIYSEAPYNPFDYATGPIFQTHFTFKDTCYYFNRHYKADYPTAAAHCRQLEGTLAMPKTFDVNNFLHKKMYLEIEYLKPVWIGMHDTMLEGKYVWEDGSRVGWRNFDSFNGRKGEDCIALEPVTGKWHDYRCEGHKLFSFNQDPKKSFICEVPMSECWGAKGVDSGNNQNATTSSLGDDNQIDPVRNESQEITDDSETGTDFETDLADDNAPVELLDFDDSMIDVDDVDSETGASVDDVDSKTDLLPSDPDTTMNIDDSEISTPVDNGELGDQSDSETDNIIDDGIDSNGDIDDTGKVDTCPPFNCSIDCFHDGGYKTNSDGCQICECTNE